MRTAEMIGWKEKFPCRDMGNGKVRSVGIAMAMQGSGISGVDVGSASIKLNEDGYYTLTIGAADMGNWLRYHPGPDGCGVPGLLHRPDHRLQGGYGRFPPYDSGSYASAPPM